MADRERNLIPKIAELKPIKKGKWCIKRFRGIIIINGNTIMFYWRNT